MLNVHVDNQPAGELFESEFERGVFIFNYNRQCLLHNAVSLTMPLSNDPYLFDYKHQLHPIFDMNLPEGDLRKRLQQQFGKAIANFDDLAMLEIVGKSQIGRLRFTASGESLAEIPNQSLTELITHDGAEDLFESLLERYAMYSGISGVQPKIMIRDSDMLETTRVTHKDATHIVKAWHESEYPQLAANEYFCLRAAKLANLSVPNFSLSDHGKFLIIERFDLSNNRYLGFEDFCVLNAKTSEQKYDGSYENITKRIRDFVSADQVHSTLEHFFKTLALSCAVKNGDAHLKNFGVLYDNSEASVRLSPAYDIVSTTPYNPKDSLALTLGGSKRWPKYKTLIKFARTHCDLTESRAQEIIGEVADGMVSAMSEINSYLHQTPAFRQMGEVMVSEWNKGINLSLRVDG